MNLSVYYNKCVKIDCSNGFYYSGKIISVEDDAVTLSDKHDKLVTLKIDSIVNVREMSQ